jgi:hypothetical protein
MTQNLPDFLLVSNGYPLKTSPDRLGWLASTDPNQPIGELREQYQAQGYLWLKGLIPRNDVLDFRRRYFTAIADSGILAPGTDPTDGIYAGHPPGRSQTSVYQIVRWARYEAFCLSQPIISFYEQFLGGAVYLHKRKIVRMSKPGDESCTGAHYDLVYLRGGTDRLCSSWIPIGDTSVDMGGLIYLEGSDSFGRRKEAEFTTLNAALPPEERISAYNRNMNAGWLSKDLPSMADELNSRWLVADYEAGDMVVHSPYMIHASTMNINPAGRMRLSTDIRYQLVTDDIDPRWGKDWSPDDGL